MEQDIIEEVERQFGAAASMAVAMLQAYQATADTTPRVLRAIVVLSEGSVEGLRKSIQEAETDWRDVIHYAETVSFELNKPFTS